MWVVFSINKTDHHNITDHHYITEILWKMALNTITLTLINHDGIVCWDDVLDTILHDNLSFGMVYMIQPYKLDSLSFGWCTRGHLNVTP